MEVDWDISLIQSKNSCFGERARIPLWIPVLMTLQCLTETKTSSAFMTTMFPKSQMKFQDLLYKQKKDPICFGRNVIGAVKWKIA